MRRIVWMMAIIALAISDIPRCAVGQLQITEVMYDSVDDSNWEWIEVRNSSDVAIDLNGYFLDDNGGNAIPTDADPSIWNVANGGQAANTVVPAGGVAVLYDGDALAFDDSRFRAAWQLAQSVSVIGVSFFPGLNNGGDEFGLWPSQTAYALDVGDGSDPPDGTFEVLQFTNADASLNYQPDNGFPDGSEVSIAWNGMGDYQDGAGWSLSEDGVNGARTSVQTFLPGMEPFNDAMDVANPGTVPAGTAAGGFLITELMYNPRSPEPGWEWVEVHNNTGAAIDFADTPYVLDDPGGDALTEANVTSGMIADGNTAIFFDASITINDMQMAWGAGNNYIPVSDWSALSNGGDTVGIWSSHGPDYLDDKTDDVFDTAIATVQYDDSGDWPADDGNGSIYLSDLSLDPNNGLNWVLSNAEDGLSAQATQLYTDNQPEDHPGGDIGSPGLGPGETQPPVVSADLNKDTLVDCDDIDLLYAKISSGENEAAYDLNDDGMVDDGDIPVFLQAAATAIGFSEAIRSGDANLNGVIDAADLNIVGLNWLDENVTSWCTGDFNRDGTVNANDLNSIGVHWLSDVRGNGAPLSATVPEPSSMALWLGAGLLLIGSRKRSA